MSQKYKLLYYLKWMYVGGFSHWSEQKLKMHIHSLPGGALERQKYSGFQMAVNKSAHK